METPAHEFEFRFDVPFVENALRRDFLWRTWLIGLVFSLLTLVGFRLVFGQFVPTVVVASVAALFIIGFAGHFKLKRIATRICELWKTQSPSGTIRYRLDEEGVDVHFDNAQSRFEWASLRKLWCYPDVWMLEVVKMQSLFFPPDQAPQEARDYIRARCEAAGVPVKA